MENELTLSTQTTLFCASCNITVTNNDAFCDGCGYPLKGEKKDQDAFIANRAANEIDLWDYNKKIKDAGNALYWIAGIIVFYAVIMYFTSTDEEGKVTLAIVNLVLAMIFVALGGWSRKKPFAALVSGSALYAIMLVLNAIDDPLTLVRGIIFKIAVIAALVKGIRSALDAEKVKKELNID